MKEEFDLSEIDEFDKLSRTKSNKVQLGGLSNLEMIQAQAQGFPPNEAVQSVLLTTDSKKLPPITASFFQQHFPNLKEIHLNSSSKLYVLLEKDADKDSKACNHSHRKNVLCIEKICFSSSKHSGIEFVTAEEADEQNINLLVCASSIKSLTLTNCSSQKFFDIATKFKNLEVLTLSIPNSAPSPKNKESAGPGWSVFDNFNSKIPLKKLCLSNCSIDQNDFFCKLLNEKEYSSVFADVESIDLSNNNIREIYGPMLTQHKNLKELKLRNNIIESIKFDDNFFQTDAAPFTDELTFDEKTQLFGQFEEVFSKFLTALEESQELDLCRSPEGTSAKSYTYKDEKIQIFLDLTANLMDVEVSFRKSLIDLQFQKNAENFPKIQIEFLDLSQNNLKDDFFSSFFSRFQWPNLSTLHLSNNDLGVIPFYFWLSSDFLSQISLLNLSKNVRLNFNWSFNEFLNAKDGFQFPFLKEFFQKKKWFPIFDLNGDCILKNAKKIMMENVSIYKENEFRYITSGKNSLEYHPKIGNLTELNFGDNQISRFFQFPSNLKTLNLKNNHLTIESPTIIAKLPENSEKNEKLGLQHLLLSGNKIFGFPSNLMEFTDLKTIEFDYPLKQIFALSDKDGPFTSYSEMMKNVNTAEEKNLLAWIMHKKIKYSNSCSKPNKIIDGLYLGNALSAKNKHYLLKKKITGIISLLTEYQPRFPDYFQYHVVAVEDNLDDSQFLKGKFLECCLFIEKHLNFGGKILVHCQAGRSRSATIVIAYLMWKHSMSAEIAYDTVMKKRPEISPNVGFVKQLAIFEKELKDQAFDINKISLI